MDYDKKINEILSKIKAEKGEEDTLRTLEALLSGGKEGDSRGEVLKAILSGGLTKEEIKEKAEQQHMAEKGPFRVFLISFKADFDDTVLSVLYSMFDPSVSDVVQMDETHIAILVYNEAVSDEPDIDVAAHSIYDTLSTEALVAHRVAYDETVEEIYDLPEQYANLRVSEKLGYMFFSERPVYGYHDLGLGRLLYSVPAKERVSYMKDNLPKVDFREMDEETLTTVRTFFDTGLNVAETARRLYLHRNTLVYRLDKFEKQTGLDLRDLDDAIACRIGMMIWEMMD